jgi:hypothetical protein
MCAGRFSPSQKWKREGRGSGSGNILFIGIKGFMELGIACQLSGLGVTEFRLYRV